MEYRDYIKTQIEALKKGNITRITTTGGGDIGHEEIYQNGIFLAENSTRIGKTKEVAAAFQLTETLQAKPHLIFFGAGHVAKALYDLATLIGLSVTVIDPREEVANRERFPYAEILQMPYESYFEGEHEYYNSFYCIFTHGHAYDKECLRYALTQPCAYIGMIGSKGKVAATFNSLKEEGFTDEQLSFVHSPIGLKIGGDSPYEIAVSIMAEIISVYAEKKHRATVDTDYLKAIMEKGEGVICRIIRKSGSGPREAGTEMFVTADEVIGTIGGGALEKNVIEDARQVKDNTIKHYGLNANDDLGMICGGDVDILFEVIK